MLSNTGFEVSTATVDVSSRGSVHALVQTATACGDITGVIHAAGVSPRFGGRQMPGATVKLDGYRLQPPNTIEVLGLNRNRIVLLVVPPHTDPDRAHATLMAAAAPDNDSTVDGLFMISLRDRESRTQRAAAQERWDSEGGAVR